MAHLGREVAELKEAMNEGAVSWIAEESVDIFILLLGIAQRCGFDLLGTAVCKFEALQTRKWAAPDAEGVIEHIREGEDA